MTSKNSQLDLKQWTSDQYMKSIKILHIALVSGIVLILIALTNVIGFDQINFKHINYTLVGLVGIGLISTAILGKVISEKRMKETLNTDSLESKLMSYRTNKIVQLVFTEGPILISIILAFSWREYAMFLLAFFAVIYMASLRPSKDEIIAKIPLNSAEKKYLNGHMTLGEWESNNELS